MSHRLIQFYSSANLRSIQSTIASKDYIVDHWKVSDSTKGHVFTLLVNTADVERTTDMLQTKLGKKKIKRIAVLQVDALFPKPKEEASPASRKLRGTKISREELCEDVLKGSVVDNTFFMLIFFSTIVAAIGLLDDNVAVVIGAMVIAPLLGPNIALALGTALGDKKLIIQSLKANIIGFSLTLGLSFIIGLLWTGKLDSHELLQRTNVDFASIVLAVASGAAGVISLTTGVSSVLVGVMVAVALLPPAATFGIFLAHQDYGHAANAGLLLAVNVVSVNLAAKLVLLARGIKPRTWYEKRRAKNAMSYYIAFWIISLSILGIIIYLRSHHILESIEELT